MNKKRFYLYENCVGDTIISKIELDDSAVCRMCGDDALEYISDFIELHELFLDLCNSVKHEYKDYDDILGLAEHYWGKRKELDDE